MAICLACIIGLCSGTKLMLVPSFIVLVTAEALAKPTNASAMSAIEEGIEPSGVPP